MYIVYSTSVASWYAVEPHLSSADYLAIELMIFIVFVVHLIELLTLSI